MMIKTRSFAFLFSIGCAASAGCAVTTGPGDDIVDLTGTGGMTGGGGTTATGGTTGVPATGGTTGVPATGGTTGVPATGGGGGVIPPATGGGGGVIPSGAYPATITPNTILMAGYVTSGPWKGYAYTWKGMMGTASDVVNPAELVNDLCAWGSLGLSYQSILGLGISTNQAVGTDEKGKWDISTASGIAYSVTNDGGTPLRIQVTVGTTAYCTEISTAKGAATGTALWADFNSECYVGGMGVDLPATGEIDSVDVVAPGDLTVARAPAFCIASIAPAP